MKKECLRCGAEIRDRELVLECKRCRFMWASERWEWLMEYNEGKVASIDGWEEVPRGCLAIFGWEEI